MARHDNPYDPPKETMKLVVQKKLQSPQSRVMTWVMLAALFIFIVAMWYLLIPEFH